MPRVWGSWDCQDCGKVKITAKLQDCPRCDNPRDQVNQPDEKPYLNRAGDVTAVDGLTKPVWPSKLVDDVEIQRVENSSQTYRVYLLDGAERRTRSIDFADWAQLDLGDTVTGRKTRLGKIRGIDI